MGHRYSAYNVVFQEDSSGDTVCYNSASGKFVVIPNGEAEAGSRPMEREMVPEGPLADLLLENGMLVDAELDEAAMIEQRNRSWKNTGKMILTVSLTQGCNFDCPYCFEPHLQKTTIGGAVQARLLAYIERMLPHKSGLVVDWYGGEPLLRFDVLCELDRTIAKLCDQASVPFASSISTNGGLLTRDRAQRLAEETRVQSVRICIDGPPEIHDKYRPFAGGHGSFHLVWANMISCIDVLKLKIRINVDKGNADHVGRLLDMIFDSPLNHPNLSVVVKPIISSRLRPRDNAYTPQDWAAVGPRLKQLVLDCGLKLEGGGERSCAHCVAFSNDQFMIDHRGYLYKCSDTFNPDEAVGELLDGGELRLDQAKIDPWTVFPTHYDEACRKCAALPLCMGGCTFRRFAFGANWCGAERYNLEGHARLRYKAALASASPAVTRMEADQTVTLPVTRRRGADRDRVLHSAGTP